MNWRRLGEIAALSVLLFILLPLVVRVFGGTYVDGVLMGTGVAIVWYTLETMDLRRETSILRRETATLSERALEQIRIGTEQNKIAREQADAAHEQADVAIRPLLVTRIEFHSTGTRFVLRNIGHGPALFVHVELFTVEIAMKGPWRVRVFPVDLVEPNNIAIPDVEFHLVEGQGQVPIYNDFISSLSSPPSGRSIARAEITVTYEDVKRRRFQSVMEMGMGGTKLLKYESM